MSQYLIEKLEELIRLVRQQEPTEADYAEFGRRCAAIARLVVEAKSPYPEFTGMVRATESNPNWSELQHAFFKAWKRVR